MLVKYSWILGALLVAGSANAQSEAPMPRDTVLEADTSEIGVDITPSSIDTRSISQGTNGALPKVPAGWVNIDDLPPEGPLKGERRTSSAARRSIFSTARLDGHRLDVVGPAIVATYPATAFIRPVISKYVLGAEDTVIESSRMVRSGSTWRYAYVAQAGYRVEGVWVMEGGNAKWLPTSGSYTFKSNSILVPQVVRNSEPWVGGRGVPFISDPVRPVPVRRVVRRRSAKKNSVARSGTGRAVSSTRVTRTKPASGAAKPATTSGAAAKPAP